jgi:hypothetical protein
MKLFEVWKKIQNRIQHDKPKEWSTVLLDFISNGYKEDLKNRKMYLDVFPINFEGLESTEELYKTLEAKLKLTTYEIVDIKSLLIVYIRQKEV